MKRALAPLLAALSLVSLSSVAQALDLEGVYRITARDECEGDKIDAVILFSDADGNARATLASEKYGIVYQTHELSWDGGDELSGSTTVDSIDAATFTAKLSDEDTALSGTVDSVVCAPWRFRAERVALDWSDTLTALPSAPSLDTFVGTFATKTGFSEGTLRLVRLADGRLVANYGTPTVPRIIGFDGQRLDTEIGALELFAYDEHELRVKWHLRYGTEGGKLALSGYGLSTSGRFYSVNGKRL